MVEKKTVERLKYWIEQSVKEAETSWSTDGYSTYGKFSKITDPREMTDEEVIEEVKQRLLTGKTLEERLEEKIQEALWQASESILSQMFSTPPLLSKLRDKGLTKLDGETNIPTVADYDYEKGSEEDAED